MAWSYQELREGPVLPWQCSRPSFVSTFELPQQAPGNVIIAAASIGLVEHEGVDVHTKFIACLGGVMKPFHRRHQRPTGFHEDRTQAEEEAGLQVVHAGQPSGEQGAIVIIVVVAVLETLML